MKRLLAFGLVFCLLLALSSGAVWADSGDLEAKVAALVNEQRAQAGLGALQVSKELSAAAKIKAQDMADRGYFSHTSPTYGPPAEMLRSLGISYGLVGENIAKGFLTPETVMFAWMRSSGHKANILNPAYQEIGVACVRDSRGTLYWVQLFRR